MIVSISNLYPRPDQPQRGIFNAQLFRAMAEVVLARETRQPEQGPSALKVPGVEFRPLFPNENLCLVPEWRLWRWPVIRRWRDPNGSSGAGVCGSEGVPESLITHYVPVFYMPWIGRNLSWRTYGWSLARWSARLRGSEAILVTWLYPDGVAAVHWGEKIGIPVWIMVQGSDTFHLDSLCRRRAILQACARASGIICVCETLADTMRTRGVDPVKIRVIPNGVDTAQFRFRASTEALGKLPMSVRLESVLRSRQGGNQQQEQAARSGILLFVGNLVPVKGPDLMLKVFALLAEGDPGCLGKSSSGFYQGLLLLIIGEGPMRSALARQAAELGIADRVHFLGSQPHRDVALWMNVADGLCLSSRSEGMPNVILEALASGLPVVATDAGACCSMLAGEKGARIVAIREEGKRAGLCGGVGVEGNGLEMRLAHALREILTTEIDRPAMAVRHAARWSWRNQAEAILQQMKIAGIGVL